VAGRETNPETGYVDAARWHWDGSAWSPTEYLGHVDGNSGNAQGKTIANDITADGTFVVGYNTFDGDPFTTTGFIWTDSTGCMDVDFWLADKGVDVDQAFDIQGLTACTPDGQYIVGYGQDIFSPYTRRGFLIHNDRSPVGVAPAPAHAAASLLQLSAAPNPARSGTSFTLALPSAGRAEFSIYDATGRRVRSLIASDLAAGSHVVAWDGRDESGARVGAGIYFTRLKVGASSTGGKLVVIE
jgi:hypothetical protein